MESIVNQIEDFYETETVIRACILCSDESTVTSLAHELEAKHHSVDVITDEELTDERMPFVHKLHAFRESSRVIAMSYSAWYTLQDRVETDILPYQNAFIIVNFEHGLVHYIASHLQDATNRGFFMKDVKNHILVLSSE